MSLEYTHNDDVADLLHESEQQLAAMVKDRDRWVEIAQLWDGAYSAQTYIHGLDEIETADMARKAQAKVVRGEA